MTSLRITSPSAAAAFVLVDMLEEHGGTTTAPQGDGTWEITVGLNGSALSALPRALSCVQQWLKQCGLNSAVVTLDDQTHILHEDSRGAVATP